MALSKRLVLEHVAGWMYDELMAPYPVGPGGRPSDAELVARALRVANDGGFVVDIAHEYDDWWTRHAGIRITETDATRACELMYSWMEG